MTQLFGFPIDTLTSILLTTTVSIIAIVLLLALGNFLFFKIGARNIPRRRTQMILITFALMLSTTLLSSVLATGDVITSAVQSVAVYNLGNVDETITGGHGTLGYFPDGVYYEILDHAKQNSDIAAVGAALVENNLLVADESSRQVRSKVTALGIIPGSEQGFGGIQDDKGKKPLTIAGLGSNDVYLNHTAAQLLNARPGDQLFMYSNHWPGQRYQIHVVAIVANGGLIGETPYILSNIQTFRTIEARYDDITEIFISNRGGGGVNGVDLSDRVTKRLQNWIPQDEHVQQVKKEGVQSSQKAQDIFSRVFALFSLFALAIGLLLIFLIFVLLAAERRAEMGMARAIGVQRRHIILMFLFEGTIYDLLASMVGLGLGIAIGALLIYFLGPILARFDFPLKLTFQLHSLIIAYCLGVVFTFCSVVISSWLVSRMTVVEAMRDLSEPGKHILSLGDLCLRLLELLRNAATHLNPVRKYIRGNHAGRPAYPRIHHPGRDLKKGLHILLEQLPDTLVGLMRALTLLGFLPLLAGLWLMQLGLASMRIVYFSLGLSLIVFGAALLLKTGIEFAIGIVMSRALAAPPSSIVGALLDPNGFVHHSNSGPGMKLLAPNSSSREAKVRARINKIFATSVGLSLVAYWALPFDVLAHLGLPRFQGGLEIFFLAGFMMVLAMTWVIIANAELILGPLLSLCSRIPGLYILSKLASAYPLHRRFRTGLSVVMFSLVVFAMTVMAVITNAMQNTYANIDTQTGGYDIQAVAYFKPLPDLHGLQKTLAKQGINPDSFSVIGLRSGTAVGVIQLSTQIPRWTLYPAQVVSGGFLHGFGLRLVARAQGFNSDVAVWQALQAHPNYALIDSHALPYRPDSIINPPVYDPNAPLPADAGVPIYPPGFIPQYTFSISGVYQDDTSFPATPIWVADIQRPSALKLTIIGVVDNSDNAHFGLFIPQVAYDKIHVEPLQMQALPLDIQGSDAFQTTYYFKVAPGQDKRALALALGSAFLDNGLETTVLEDAIWEVRGPRIFLSNLLLAIVGLTLLLGVTALAITGTRAVIERRQQIGMLRALGCKRRLLQGAFLFESFFVGAIGSILGIVLGLILARNIFAVNFFEQFNIGLSFTVPWQELAIIVGVALLASFLGALLPAWQAGKVAPAEALRYM